MRAGSKLVTVLVLICTGIIPIRTATSQDNPPPLSIEILSHDASAFPVISVDLRVQQGGDAVSGLTAENFSIGETSTNLTLESASSLPISTAIIVDLSTGSDIDIIQATLLAYLDLAYHDGDKLTLFLVESPTPRQVEITSAAEAQALIANMQPGPNSYDIGPALEQALQKLIEIREGNVGQPVEAMLVGSYVFVSASVEANLFSQNGIRLHIVQAHHNRQPSTPGFESITDVTGGVFVDNRNGQFTPARGQFGATAIGELQDLYRLFNANRVIYRLTYRTGQINVEQNHPVEITLNIPDLPPVSASFTYIPAFQRPAVQIVEPTNFNPLREPQSDFSFNNNEEKIYVQVSYADGVERAVQSIRLEVTHRETGSLTQIPLEIAELERDESGNYILPWALDAYIQPGSNIPVTLNVAVTDELGLTGSTSQPGSVTVAALVQSPSATPQASLTPLPTFTPQPSFTLPPTFTPQFTFTPFPTFTSPPTFTPQPTFTSQFTFTPLPTFTPQPTGTSQVIFLPAPSLTSQATLIPQATTEPVSVILPNSSQSIDRILVIGLGMVAMVLGMLALFLRRTAPGRRLAQQSALAARTAVYKVRTDVFGFDTDAGSVESIKEANKFGELIVIRGIDDVDAIPITRARFIIGRELSAGCNYAIPLSYMSSQHFSIFYEWESFKIMDMNSSNGTRVNGHKLQPGLEYPLMPGSRITIAHQLELELRTPNHPAPGAEVRIEMMDAPSPDPQHDFPTQTSDKTEPVPLWPEAHSRFRARRDGGGLRSPYSEQALPDDEDSSPARPDDTPLTGKRKRGSIWEPLDDSDERE